MARPCCSFCCSPQGCPCFCTRASATTGTRCTPPGAVTGYAQDVQSLTDDAYDAMLQAARDYNQSLAARETSYFLSERQQAEYDSLLDVGGTGIMGYIEIPAINVSLPIYHGTDDNVLQIGRRHISWTSLPVGGESSHCVLSRPPRAAEREAVYESRPAGRGRYVHHPRARRGPDLRGRPDPHRRAGGCVRAGDHPRARPVHAGDVHALRYQHPPLLVRGTRIENEPQAQTVRVTSDAVQIEPLLVAPVLAAPVLLILLLVLLLPGKQKRKKEED